MGSLRLPNVREWFGRGPQHSPAEKGARLTLDDHRLVVYAIGDIHGCFDLLLRIEAMIVADSERYTGRPKAIVVLGDLIDRGPKSAEVLEHLIAQPPPGFLRFVLAGNHEVAMLDFLRNPKADQQWLYIGGRETLASYGVRVIQRDLDRDANWRLGNAAAASIPEEHVSFVRRLPVALTWGRYVFVHAGVRPDVPFHRQVDRDLLEIRGEFTDSDADHGFIVVHGHTPGPQPVRHPNRVSVDVAPYATGRLACARIDGESVDFLVCGQRPA